VHMLFLSVKLFESDTPSSLTTLTLKISFELLMLHAIIRVLNRWAGERLVASGWGIWLWAGVLALVSSLELCLYFEVQPQSFLYLAGVQGIGGDGCRNLPELSAKSSKSLCTSLCRNFGGGCVTLPELICRNLRNFAGTLPELVARTSDHYSGTIAEVVGTLQELWRNPVPGSCR
jgi:hypothetical protein